MDTCLNLFYYLQDNWNQMAAWESYISFFIVGIPGNSANFRHI